MTSDDDRPANFSIALLIALPLAAMLWLVIYWLLSSVVPILSEVLQ